DALPAWVWVAGIAGLAVRVVAFLLMGRRARALGHLDDGRCPLIPGRPPEGTGPALARPHAPRVVTRPHDKEPHRHDRH
ncbi:hypothetical protein R0J91_21490, partial [Micrococcus sp. SIMBA_131]